MINKQLAMEIRTSYWGTGIAAVDQRSAVSSGPLGSPPTPTPALGWTGVGVDRSADDGPPSLPLVSKCEQGCCPGSSASTRRRGMGEGSVWMSIWSIFLPSFYGAVGLALLRGSVLSTAT